MNLTFAVGIPTLNRRDLLIDALHEYAKDFPNTEFFLVDNGNQGDWKLDDFPDIISIRQRNKNIGVAASWNDLCHDIFFLDYDYALILNDDIYLGRTEKEIQQFLNENLESPFICSTKNWCAFAISQKTFNIVGKFDDAFFPAYFEDQDYAYRMKLKGITPLYSDFLDPLVYRNSMTLQKDISINDNFMKNKQYFMDKWGGEPGKETFTTPFNDAEYESN